MNLEVFKMLQTQFTLPCLFESSVVDWRYLLSWYTSQIGEIISRCGSKFNKNAQKATINSTACISIFSNLPYLSSFKTPREGEATCTLEEEFLRASILSEGGTHLTSFIARRYITYHFWYCITGIYGHTAVYYSAKGIMLVFGGYRFRVHIVSASGELYSLDLATRKWSILQALPSNEVSPAQSWFNLPSAFNSKRKKNNLLCVLFGRSVFTIQTLKSVGSYQNMP